MRDYNVQNVLTFMAQNQKLGGGFDVHDIRGTTTKWINENSIDDGKFVDAHTGQPSKLEGSHIERNVIKPDPNSVIHDIVISGYEIVKGTNAAGNYERVCFRTSELGFYRVLFVETVTPVGGDALPYQRLAVDQDWMNSQKAA